MRTLDGARIFAEFEKVPPVPLALCIKAFQTKKGGREGDFKNRIKINRT
jgi:hypothetical protein